MYTEDNIGDGKRDYLHDFLERTTYDDERKRTLHFIIDELRHNHQYEYVIKKLEMNEIQDKDRISLGLNYSQSDIKKRLK
jgi:hypothetical protein